MGKLVISYICTLEINDPIRLLPKNVIRMEHSLAYKMVQWVVLQL